MANVQLDINSTVRASENVMVAELDDELVMMHLDQGSYFGLDDIASQIWQLLGPVPIPIHTVCDQLAAKYNVDQETCEAHTLRFLQKLVNRQLVIAEPQS